MVSGYREARQVGAGRTGRVFLATYQATGAYVAIKYLNATLRRDIEFMDRFRSDTHRLVEIDDPGVVRLYEYVETQTRAAVVMELVDGVSLRTLLEEHGRTGPEAALAVLKSTLLALAAAHEEGVPHRDVQPGNILVQADGGIKLTDFGVVVHAEEPGVPAGTPAYMSPELWTRGEAGPPADLYAAACVLFETAKGHPPYRAQDVPALRDMHLVEPVPLERAPDTLRDLLKRGLAKDPAARYASARRFAAELEEDATAAYGPDWENRGRRHLAELATGLALRFPLAKGNGRESAAPSRLRVPRLPPQLWVAGAAVAATVIAIMASGGRMPPGPGAILMPPPQAQDDPTPSSAPTPDRTTAAPRRTATPPPAPSSRPPTPTGRQGGTSGPRPAVRAAGIVRWTGTSGRITITTDTTSRVRLRVTYTRRDGEEGAARTILQQSRVLRGRTAYTVDVTNAPGPVTCGGRAYAGILVMTEPAARNGPQVSEAALDGPACPAPSPTRSPTHSPPTPAPEGTASATGTATPSDPALVDQPSVR
ncbi:protein kinase [Nonomuraea sp. NPDC050643]|uniref:serine/threonine-protein kinase n=1 Tax=Nonomuraea sp. NPDC050643 TaxID=3155660 RepID=UPI0033EA2598